MNKDIKLSTILYNIITIAPLILSLSSWLFNDDEKLKWLDIKLKIIITLVGVIIMLVIIIIFKIINTIKLSQQINKTEDIIDDLNTKINYWINEDESNKKTMRLYEHYFEEIGYHISNSQCDASKEKLEFLYTIYNKIYKDYILGGNIYE